MLKLFKEEIEPHLRPFFEDYLKTMAGPRATRFVGEATGVSTRDDDVEILELDPEWSKRRCYRKWCYKNGYKLTASARSTITYEKRTNVPDDFEYGKLCCWAKFLDYWKAEYPKLIVRRATADICTTCYKFHIANRKCVNKDSNYECGNDYSKETEETEDSDDEEDSDSNKEGAEETLEETLETIGSEKKRRS
jgi:hypothetical protein